MWAPETRESPQTEIQVLMIRSGAPVPPNGKGKGTWKATDTLMAKEGPGMGVQECE